MCTLQLLKQHRIFQVEDRDSIAYDVSVAYCSILLHFVEIDGIFAHIPLMRSNTYSWQHYMNYV